jgi:RNA polymerase sigma factor (sigma-70 family)
MDRMNDLPTPEADDRFPTTAWHCIETAQDPDHPDCVEHRNTLLVRYWKPVFYFLRARGCNLHQAEDLTQEFFTRFLDRDWLARADPNRGRFRNYLLTILIRFLADHGPARAPRQSAFEHRFVSLSTLLTDEERQYEPPDHETPETIFLKKWAGALILTARHRLQVMCQKKNRMDWFALFETVHDRDDPATQEQLAAAFGLSRDQVRYALDQTRQWFKHLLREEVRKETVSEDELNDEVRELLAVIQT